MSKIKLNLIGKPIITNFSLEHLTAEEKVRFEDFCIIVNAIVSGNYTEFN